MFYFTTHSTHFIYGYMASDIWLRTILIVRKETRCRHIGYSYRLTARVLLYAPSQRQDNTYHGLCYTSRGALAGTRNSSMGPPYRSEMKLRGSVCVHWAMGRRIYPSWWTHSAISRFSQIHRSCITKAVICAILFVGWMVYKKEPLLLIGKSSPRGSGSGFLLSLSWWSFTIYLMPYNQKVILMKYRGNHIELKGSLLNEYSSTTILLDYSFYVNRIYTIWEYFF